MEYVEDGYLLPLRGAPAPGGGVLDKDKRFVESSALLFRNHSVQYPGEDYITAGGGYCIDDEDYDVLDEEIIYLGPIGNHWGHFLQDCTVRLWYAKEQRNGRRCAFIANYKEPHRIIDNITRFITLLGIPLSEVLFVHRVSRCKRIIIPEASYRPNDYYSEQYLSTFDAVASNVDYEKFKRRERVYFTRIHYPQAKHYEVGEEMLINLFQKNGFYITSPEECTLDKQIALIRQSDIVASLSGTIPHNMLFSRDGQKIIIINKTYVMNMTQMDINIMRRLNATYVDAYVTLFQSVSSPGPFLYLYNSNLKAFVKDSGYIDVDEKYKSEKLNRAFLKRYIATYRREHFMKGKKGKFIFDESSVNYFEPELLNIFLERCYLLLHPISIVDHIANAIDNSFVMNKCRRFLRLARMVLTTPSRVVEKIRARLRRKAQKYS